MVEFLTGLGIGVAVAAGIGWLIHRRREEQLRELVLYLLQVQDGIQLPAFESYAEGQLGILQSEIYKFVTILEEQSVHMKRENAYLAQMMSDISHQIKTPLAAITLMSDLMKDADLPADKCREYAEKIGRQTEKIHWLVRNLLTLASLEADMLPLKKERIQAFCLLEKACAPFEVLAELRHVAVTIKAEPAVELVCDRVWTEEAIGNIVKNCIEHTGGDQPGHVCITVVQHNFAVVIRIQDDGCGIAKEDVPHIFERFYKGKHASKNSVGIGLAMARQIILQQNGTIQVTSTEGEGTAFEVKLYQ